MQNKGAVKKVQQKGNHVDKIIRKTVDPNGYSEEARDSVLLNEGMRNYHIFTSAKVPRVLS